MTDIYDLQRVIMARDIESERPPAGRPTAMPGATLGTAAGLREQYIVLDTFEKVRDSSNERGDYRYNFMVQGSTRNQMIGVEDRLDMVIGVQVCEFSVPLPPVDDFDPANLVAAEPGRAALGLAANGAFPGGADAVTDPRTQLPFNGRVVLHLDGLGSQAFPGADGGRYHFEFAAAVSPDGERLVLTPLVNYEYFLFTDPITHIHGLTTRFSNPDRGLRLPSDAMYSVEARADGSQLLEFVHERSSRLLNLAAGDRIFIRGFASGHSILDTWVGRPEGHIVGTAGFALAPGGTTRFRLNPDVSLAAFGYAASTRIESASAIDVLVAKNRIRIPLRFRCLADRLDAYSS
jgi:hypothetical protein